MTKNRSTSRLLFAVTLVTLFIASFNVANATASSPSCGPKIDSMTAETIEPAYRKVMGSVEGVSDFYRTIPAKGTFWVQSEDGESVVSESLMEHIEACIGRMAKLLEPRAEGGDPDAQYLLGQLLLDAYYILRGGPAGHSANRSEGRERAHRWLLKAAQSGNCEARNALAWYYNLQLNISQYRSETHELGGQAEHPWLPSPPDMLTWLESASETGNLMASSKLAEHYLTRAGKARASDPEATARYFERMKFYFAAAQKQTETAATWCPQLFKTESQ